MPESFGIQGFVIRWIMAMFLVLATFNPSGYSYFHWITDLDDGDWVLKLLIGVVLVILYATFGLATQRSLAAGFRLLHHPKPLQEAGRWWMVSGTLVDLLSLGTLTWLTRLEGIRLVDLFNVRRERLGRCRGQEATGRSPSRRNPRPCGARWRP